MSRNVLEYVSYYSKFNQLYNQKERTDFALSQFGSIIFVVGKSPMDIMEPILL